MVNPRKGIARGTAGGPVPTGIGPRNPPVLGESASIGGTEAPDPRAQCEANLTPEHFEECPVRTLGPFGDSPYPHGFHTLSACGNYTLVDAKWQGLAAYLNYQFNDQWRLSLRGEYFDDKDGYRTGFTQKWKEATLTLAYLPTKNIEVRGEIRGDRSNQSTFLKSDGVTTSRTQHSAGLEFLYKF